MAEWSKAPDSSSGLRKRAWASISFHSLMASSRSLFTSLIRNCTRQTQVRFVSSSVSKPENVYDESPVSATEEESGDDLKSRIFRLRLPKRSATNVIEKWVNEGREVKVEDLRGIGKELRRSRRYKHALEVDAAERYFESLPPTAKTVESYTALLHCYAASKLTSKAEDLYERIKESNLPLSAITYNELMTLYMSVGQVEKVSSVVAEESGDDLKSRIFRLRLPKRSATNVIEKWVNEGREVKVEDLRGIGKELRRSRRYKHALELSEWMVSRGDFELSDSDYAFRIDLMTKVFGIDAAERYFESLPPTAKTIESYTALLHCYAASKLTSKAEDLYERIKESNLPLSAITYNELMTLYMSVGQVEKFNEVGEVIDQWKTSATTDFDAAVCERLVKALEEVGLTEKAEAFRILLSEKMCDPQ
nr:hypothetical protein [Tanacetum cinerariifolium]